MKLVVVGVNHKTAPVAMRERLAFGEDLSDALVSLQDKTSGAVIVSTCNRSEIYAYLPQTDDAFCEDDEWSVNDGAIDKSHHQLVSWLSEYKGLNASDIAPFLYVYQGNRALNHWLRVAVGLDSMILGEPQILGQIKQAVAMAHQAGVMTPAFDWLTQRIFAAARIVRRDTSLGAQAVTLGFATAKLVTQIFDAPAKTTLLIVAAGEMNRLVAHNVASLGVARIIICNRSQERAELLADELSQMAKASGQESDIRIMPLTHLAEALTQADVVSSCSGSMDTLIDVAMVKKALTVRRHRAMLLVDLAVPRDIAPEVGRLDNVYLYSIDDLQHVIAGNIEARKQAAVEAELLVSQLTAKVEAELSVANMGGVIAAYQTNAEHKKTQLLAYAKRDLDNGVDPMAVLEKFAYQLTNTLNHPPLKLLRSSALTSDDKMMEYISQGLLDAYRK